MDAISRLFLPALAALALAVPVGFAFRLGKKLLRGALLLLLVNAAAPITGLALPINALTVLAAGLGGLPGMGALLLWSLL